MKNQIIELKNTVEAFDVRIERMQSQLQVAIDAMRSSSIDIAESDDTLHNVVEASKILGVSPYVIRHEIASNRLQAIQRGRRNFIRQDDLNDYVKNN